MAQAALLDSRAVIALAGPDARSFLQGLVTNDMVHCQGDTALYAALLAPQGKILFDFFIDEAEDERFFIDCAATQSDALFKRLSMYRLRAKLDITPQPSLAVGAVWDGGLAAPPPGIDVFRDPRLPELGVRLVGPKLLVQGALAGMERGDYMAHRLALGVPEGGTDYGSDEVFALDAGFEELHGVSFKKGCYVGQEVTARMKHRATARRRFVIVEGATPERGAALSSEGRDLGTLASGTDGIALALVRLDRLAEAAEHGATIMAGERVVTLRKPYWLAV